MNLSTKELQTTLNFRVEISSLSLGDFSYVGGLESVAVGAQETDRPGDRPGKNFSNIVLRRPLDKNRELWDWYQASLRGENVKQDVEITLLNDANEGIVKIVVRQASPCRWKVTPFDTHNPETLLEEIELVLESFEVQSS